MKSPKLEMDGYGSIEKWGDPNFTINGEEGDEEEETLSLCDLPVSVNQEKTEAAPLVGEGEEEFDFGSWGRFNLPEAEMCAADEVFFQGQILPLRLSVSSESGVLGTKQESWNPARCELRSEATEDNSLSSGFTTSLSSRSNSTGSHNSATTTTTTTTTYKPKFRNQFHSHPSPKPQISSGIKPGNVSSRNRKSTIWGIFKVGLIRTPEIELQERKLRNCNNKKGINSRCSSSSSSRKSDIAIKLEEKKRKKKEKFMFENCKCSVDAVETVVNIKKKKNNSVNERESKEELEEKVDKDKSEKQRKQARHHRRTFEWLKELSIADVPIEEL